MKKNLTSIIATTISILLIIAGTVGLILLQKPLRKESLDIRKDASIDNGQVLVSSSPTSGSNVEINQDTTINFQANTNGVQTDGVQLVFNLITNTLGKTPTISVPSTSGLQNSYSQIEQTSDGYLVSVIAIPQQIGGTFSSSSPTTVAQLKIKPTSGGNIEISFDREKSKSIIHASNPPEDALSHVSALNFVVSGGSSPSPSPSVSPSPSPNSSIGGVVGCNLSCSNNAECETNHRCYNGQCRLVTNVSSTTCTEEADQGLNFGCNEYCADSKECDSEYSCLENKCRRSDNPDDPYCQIPSSTIQNNITDSCGTACGSNTDCAANLRCYYGICRLATNVSSTTCSATTTKTVSNLYAEPTAPKGGNLEDQAATDSTIPAAIISKPSPSPSTDTEPLLEEETAMDAVIDSLQKAGVPVNLLSIIALAIGGLLLLLIIIPKIFGKKTKQSSLPPATMVRPQVKMPVNQPVPPVINTKPQPTPPQSPMMERIKEKGINTPKP